MALGGLLSAIFNEVLQFVLIWLGALLIPILGLIEAGGWTNLVAQHPSAIFGAGLHPPVAHHGHRSSDNPMGIHWTGIVFGLGVVISFGYWTTDFLVVQRVLAAKDLRAAKLAPIIGAAFKMCVPFIVILPGLLGLAVLPHEARTAKTRPSPPAATATTKCCRSCWRAIADPGLLGLGITALIAGFMSGMAGNVSAFATVWTYDIYRALYPQERHRRALRERWAAGAPSWACWSPSARPTW